VVALLLVVATAARVIGLGQDFWIDETATAVTYLRLPWWQAAQSFQSANQHLLYSILGSLSFAAFGESEVAARLPAVVFGVLGVGALYFLGRLLAPEREAVAATLLLAVSYHHVWFSQSARGYTGMIFFAILGTTFFLRALARSDGRDWAAYVACMALGILCHLNTAFVVMGQAASYTLTLLHRKESQRDRRPVTLRLLGSVASVALLSLAGHALVLRQMIGFFRTVDRTGLGWTSVGSLAPVVGEGLRAGLGLVGVAVMAALLLAGLASYARQSPLLAGLFILPAVFNAAAIVALRYGAYPRSFLYVLPFVLLLAVRGAAVMGRLSTRRSREIELAAVALLVLASVWALTFNYRYPKQDYRGALRHVMAQKGPDDEVAAVGLAAVTYRHYYGAPWLRFPQIPEELQALGAGGRRVWVLLTLPRDMRLRYPDLTGVIEKDFEPAARFRGTLGDGDLYLVRSRDVTTLASVPLHTAGGIPLVEVRVNGQGPFWFEIDTGFQNSAIERRLAESLGLSVGPEQEVKAPGGTVRRATVTGAELRLGDIVVDDPALSALDVAGFAPFFGHRVDGILGYDFLRRFVVEIDYEAGSLTMRPPSGYEYRGPGAVLPVDLSSRQPYVTASVVQGKGAPADGRFLLDTGSMDAVNLNGPFARAHDLALGRTLAIRGRSIGGETSGLLLRLDAVLLGPFRLDRPVASVVTDDVDRAGQISGETLRRFKVILDYARQRVILESNRHFPEPFEVDMAGLVLVAKGEGLERYEVFLVLEGSPAAAAGVQPGDVVVELDGTPASRIPLGELRRRLQSEGATCRLVFERDGKRRSAELKLRRLI
jgi:4-amino-4-deoxy-L-arabinose transferase-like glycosyltransferase